MFDENIRTVELFYSDEDFRGELEYCQGCVFVHLTFYNKSISAWKRMLKKFSELKNYIRNKEYQVLYTYTQNPKFVSKIGAEYLNSFKYNNKEYEVWKWELKLLR